MSNASAVSAQRAGAFNAGCVVRLALGFIAVFCFNYALAAVQVTLQRVVQPTGLLGHFLGLNSVSWLLVLAMALATSWVSTRGLEGAESRVGGLFRRPTVRFGIVFVLTIAILAPLMALMLPGGMLCDYGDHYYCAR